MSPFMEACLAFIDTQPFSIIRLAQSYQDGAIEVAECQRVGRCQNVYSGAKLFTAVAVGLLVDEGRLRIEDKICDILREELPEAGMDSRWEKATVEDALRHRLGLPGGFLDIDVQPMAAFTQDYLRYTFACPLLCDPGTEETYSDGAFYVLSRIGEKASGMGLDAYLWQKLLWKMEFGEMAWSRCPMGHVLGGSDLYLHAADMVKLGRLILNDGVYQGERLLSSAWTQRMKTHGYVMDWDEQHRIYYKGGMHGQKLIMAPEQGRVVAMQAYGANSQVVAEFVRDYGNRP